MKRYLWGLIQGTLLVFMGFAGFLVGGFLNNGTLSLDIEFVAIGLCLIWKMKGGVIGLAGLAVYILWHIISDQQHVPASVAMLVFLAGPLLLYYPKRWSTLTWTGRKRK